MHERMKYINELVRNGVKITIITPTYVLDNEEKKEAIEYLRNDMDIDIDIKDINDEDTSIEISMKEDKFNDICVDCEHLTGIKCGLTNEFAHKNKCSDFNPLADVTIEQHDD